MRRTLFSSAVLALALHAAYAQPALPPINATTETAFAALMAHDGVKQAIDFVKSDDERTLKEQIELTEVPSPPFKESVRALDFQKRLKALGLADARIDGEGNVIAVRKGNGSGTLLVV